MKHNAVMFAAHRLSTVMASCTMQSGSGSGVRKEVAVIFAAFVLRKDTISVSYDGIMHHAQGVQCGAELHPPQRQ